MKIRVLELTAGLAVGDPLGGAARFVVELTRAFDRSAIDLFLANLWEYGTLAEQSWRSVLDAEAIPHCFAAPWDSHKPIQNGVYALRGLWHLTDFQPDIIHSHGEFTDIAAILLQRRYRARYLVRTRHNTVEWPKRPALGRLLGHWFYPAMFDAEVGISASAMQALDQRWLARRLNKRATSIYNAIDFERFKSVHKDKAAISEMLGLPDGVPVVGTVGSLVKRKGYATLLVAFARVVNSVRDAHLILVGDGPERRSLEALAVTLGIQRQVSFMGTQVRVEEILAGFDLFVCSSLVEGVPTVILESIAAGVPVIATDIPGNDEVVEDSVTGRLVSPENPDALAAAISDALKMPDLMQKLAQNAHQMTRDRFSIAAIAAQYTALFRHLMANSR